ncbi:MAG: hypothetical protein LUD82_07035 [Clostridiales bacterium]|nr:hypothetical protein [Clostridiales bacterium]
MLELFSSPEKAAKWQYICKKSSNSQWKGRAAGTAPASGPVSHSAVRPVLRRNV